MSLRKTKAIVLASAVAGVLALGATAASAAPTFSIAAGSAPAGTSVAFTGATTGTSPQITLVDTTSNLTLTCDSGTAGGHATVGTGLPNTGLANVTGSTTTWTNCVGPLGLVLIPKGTGTWKLNATKYTAATGVTTGTLAGAHATVSTSDGTSCVFKVAGSVPVTYTNSTQVLAVSPSKSNLKISGVTGCFGLINNGDVASFQANYKLTAKIAKYNPVKVTSP